MINSQFKNTTNKTDTKSLELLFDANEPRAENTTRFSPREAQALFDQIGIQNAPSLRSAKLGITTTPLSPCRVFVPGDRPDEVGYEGSLNRHKKVEPSAALSSTFHGATVSPLACTPHSGP